MKIINWNEDKNEWLKKERSISFEDVVFEILNNNILSVSQHPNQEKYPNQKIYSILINEYVFLVPFVEDDKEIFLKTIIPSRKDTKKYKTDENKK